MSEEPTPDELNQLAIEEAEARHTPTIQEMPVRTCKQMLEGIYGECEGKLEVAEVWPAYHDYEMALLRCKKCRREMYYPNPRRREKAAANQASTPNWKGRKDCGD